VSDSVGTPSQDERQWAMFCHLAGLVVCCIPVLGAFIVWKMKESSSPFVADQGKEAVNWHLSYFLVALGLGVVGYVVMAIPIVGRLYGLVQLAAFVAWAIMTIMAALKANAGERYRYPYNFRLIK
jgi:uncharacterized Tic20 family protein